MPTEELWESFIILLSLDEIAPSHPTHSERVGVAGGGVRLTKTLEGERKLDRGPRSCYPVSLGVS